jgi:hypothetical protein
MSSAQDAVGRPYRDGAADRFYVCPGCSTPQRGPAQGGQVTCPQCGAPYTLSDRSAMLGNEGYARMVPDDPARIAQLRLQDGRARAASPSLAAVLGGSGILPGREQEGLMIWQSLRARAAQGDVAASEDLATLTLLLVQLPFVDHQPQMERALRESTYDAALLPRHRQEQLGALARLAVTQGDRARAHRYLSWMIPNAPELEADSEFRVSSAAVATMDGDANRVLALLGPQKDALPVVDWMDPLASVFRANAYELLGNVEAAKMVLRELPAPGILDRVRAAYGALPLCVQSAAAYVALYNEGAAQRAASSVEGFVGNVIGGSLLMTGLLLAGITIAVGFAVGDMTDPRVLITVLITSACGLVMLAIGATILIRVRAQGKHAAWLRVSGLPLTARIVGAQRTGTTINDVPLYDLAVQVAGPHGPYPASIRKLVQEQQVAMLLGQEVRVRANPAKLDEVALEE